MVARVIIENFEGMHNRHALGRRQRQAIVALIRELRRLMSPSSEIKKTQGAVLSHALSVVSVNGLSQGTALQGVSSVIKLLICIQ